MGRMKSVMVSIRPKWCELIANGNKTIEVRKTKPRCDVPFKCYIYCTTQELLTKSYRNGKIYVALKKRYKERLEHNGNTTFSGKVIGEFICYRIDAICPDNFVVKEDAERALEGSCISIDEFKKYMKYVGTPLYMRKDAYAWHISDLVIYDEPKELTEFGLKRPPQSWCYAEVADCQSDLS